MKISFLVPNLSSNCSSRAYNFAGILSRNYECEIIGPIQGNGIWGPIDTGRFHYKFIDGRSVPPYKQLRQLLKKITGDIIYAFKPLGMSYGVALLEKLKSRRPVIIDIDDWELGFYITQMENLRPLTRVKYILSTKTTLWRTYCLEKLIPLADDITVASCFLKKKFGGTVIYHPRDTDFFNPSRFDKENLKKTFGLENRKVIAFIGSPAPYKGIEDLIESIRLILDEKIALMIVSLEENVYVERLRDLAYKKLGNKVYFVIEKDFNRVPQFLALGDVVVIPQRECATTIAQTPSKVFDAMAMAKPLIATNVSDLPEILDGCGWIVEPENQEQLAKTIQYVLSNSEDAEETGQRAKQKCIDKYSWDAVENVLVEVFGKYE